MALLLAAYGAAYTGTISFAQGNIDTINSTDITASGDVEVTGTIDGATVNTGQGDNEVYAMDQDVETTDAVTFDTVDATTDVTSPVVDTPLIQDAAAIAFQPSGDSTDYMEFSITGGNFRSTFEDSAQYQLYSDDGGMTVRIIPKKNNQASLIWTVNQTDITEGFCALYTDQNDGIEGIVLSCDDSPNNRNLVPNVDNAYQLGCLSGDTQCSANYRWSDIKSVLINGADVCFANGICLTECVTNGKIDICFVAGEPTEDQAKTIGLAAFNSYQEYRDAHMVDGEFDQSMTEEDYNTRKAQTLVDGKLDLLLGRTSHGSLREMRDTIIENQQRLDTIETALCNQGLGQFC